MERIEKVIAYVVRGDRLLVFVHADDARPDQSGVQVPAGTVRDGEAAVAAVVREVREETGLDQVRVERQLGSADYDMRPYTNEIHARTYFQMSVVGDTPNEWDHWETGSDGSRIRFHFYWIPITEAHVLAAGQGAMIGRMFE